MEIMKKIDVAVIGGSNAGLSAALFLGRARRKVLVVDEGRPRNASVREAHGFYTRDNMPPGELYRIARAQLDPYDVEYLTGKIIRIERNDDGFVLFLESGLAFAARKLLLATGIADDLPDIEGFAQQWGKTIFSCPYCDGWEIRDKKLAVIGSGEEGYEFALFLTQWSKDVTLCTDSGAIKAEDSADLARRGITIVSDKIVKIDGDEKGLRAIQFQHAAPLPCAAIFLQPDCHLRAELAEQLGLELAHEGLRIAIDEDGKTNVAGVYAAGDAATKHAHIVIAAASGANAAIALNHELFMDDRK